MSKKGHFVSEPPEGLTSSSSSASQMPSEKWICEVLGCGARFRKPAHLKRHSLVHTEERLFSCSHCSASFKRNEHLRRHMSIRHEGGGGGHALFSFSSSFTGPISDKTSSLASLNGNPTATPPLSQEIDLDTSDQSASPTTTTTKGDAAALSRQSSEGMVEAIVLPSVQTPHIDDQRPTRESSDDDLLSVHHDHHHHLPSRSSPKGTKEGENEEEKSTELTPKKVDSTRGEQSKRVDSRHRPFKCVKCGAAFLLKQHLKRHEKSHIGRHACEQCDAVFTKKRQLRWHKLEHLTLEAASKKERKDLSKKDHNHSTEEEPPSPLAFTSTSHRETPTSSSSSSSSTPSCVSSPRCCSTTRPATTTPITSSSDSTCSSSPCLGTHSEERAFFASLSNSSSPSSSSTTQASLKTKEQPQGLLSSSSSSSSQSSEETAGDSCCSLPSPLGLEDLRKTANQDERKQLKKSNRGRAEEEKIGLSLVQQETLEKEDEIVSKDNSDDKDHHSTTKEKERSHFSTSGRSQQRGGTEEAKGGDGDSSGKQAEEEKKEKMSFHCPHDNCDAVFTSLHSLYRHLKRVAERPRNYSCEVCKETFVQFSALVKHRRQEHPTNVHICEWCNKRYSRITRLREHIRKRHGGTSTAFGVMENRSNVLKMTEDKEFDDKDEADDLDTPSHMCPEPACGLSFSTASNMRVHYRVKHLQIREFLCQTCGMSFGFKSVLRRHIAKIHNQQRPSPVSLQEEDPLPVSQQSPSPPMTSTPSTTTTPVTPSSTSSLSTSLSPSETSSSTPEVSLSVQSFCPKESCQEDRVAFSSTTTTMSSTSPHQHTLPLPFACETDSVTCTSSKKDRETTRMASRLMNYSTCGASDSVVSVISKRQAIPDNLADTAGHIDNHKNRQRQDLSYYEKAPRRSTADLLQSSTDDETARKHSRKTIDSRRDLTGEKDESACDHDKSEAPAVSQSEEENASDPISEVFSSSGDNNCGDGNHRKSDRNHDGDLSAKQKKRICLEAPVNHIIDHSSSSSCRLPLSPRNDGAEGAENLAQWRKAADGVYLNLLSTTITPTAIPAGIAPLP